jgi:ABC-type sugar transport system permease subunit
VYFAAFWVLPVVLAAGYGFTDWRIGQPTRFVGLANYAGLVSDPQFHRAVLASLTITGVALAGIVAVGLGVAVALQDPALRLARLFKLAVFIPVVTDWVATGLVWQLIFLPNQGVLAGLLESVGLARWGALRWTTSRQLAPLAVATFVIWKMTGFYSMVYLAGLRSIPREFQEAARVDGAGPAQAFWHVTMPLLRPITVFVVVSGFVGIIGLFEPIYMLTGGGPADATRALPIFLYESFFQFHRAGYASAAGILFLVLCLSFALLAARQLQYSFYE